MKIKILTLIALIIVFNITLVSPASTVAQGALTNPPSPTPFIISAALQATQTPNPELAQATTSPTPRPSEVDANSDEVVFEGGSLYTAMLGIIGITCGGVILLMGMLWFFNNRRKS